MSTTLWGLELDASTVDRAGWVCRLFVTLSSMLTRKGFGVCGWRRTLLLYSVEKLLEMVMKMFLDGWCGGGCVLLLWPLMVVVVIVVQ